ncbi:hypothetical protein HDC92_000036 [Pedobacter sp. AK017]|uniref:hypothetical protein n=1 Tax=Pedobacter sp. AK017 TaxID=2723073 RepID=UPI001616F259|nr:hypothetical protein [Pedobacter sp. AK017]MBB5436372.1 hypothetical protein [Pedobacter sp. AK017]
MTLKVVTSYTSKCSRFSYMDKSCMISKNVILLSYGNKTEYCRAVFCILSFLSWTKVEKRGVRIILYTDQPDFFKPYFFSVAIQYIHLTPVLLKQMLGNTDFSHRRKVVAINDVARRFPEQDLLFIDTDTFFFANPKILTGEFKSGQSFMHVKEHTIAESLALFTSYKQPEYPTAFIKYLNSSSFSIAGKTEIFSETDYSWNSGILGISKSSFNYLPDILKLTDLFYEHSKWFLSEQLAFSFTLQRRTKIKAAAQVILHYWSASQKKQVDQLISELFEQYEANLKDRSFIRSITKKWKKQLEMTFILEHARIALANRSWYQFTKKIIQITLKQPSTLKSLFQKS